MKAIAIDVGVGQIRAALVSQGSGEIECEQVDTADRGKELQLSETCDRIQNIGNKVREAANLEWETIAGIGIALPGPINRNGVMGRTGVLPSWQGQAVMQHVRSKFPTLGASRIALVNDANAGALGEAIYGVGSNMKHVDLVYFVVSAGIGAGIVIDGTLHVGAIGNAGEWGHVVVDPAGPLCTGCKVQRGCLETLASGNAIAQRAVDLFQVGRLSSVQDVAWARGPIDQGNPVNMVTNRGGYANFSLPEMGGGRPHAVWASDIVQAATQGDPDAIQIMTDAGTALGKAIVQAIQILNPHKIVIGGVVIGNATYFDAATGWAGSHCDAVNFGLVAIQHAELPETNSLVGLAEAVFTLPIYHKAAGN